MVCRRHAINEQTLYRWNAKFGGTQTSNGQKLRTLEDEHRPPKKPIAESMLDVALLKGLFGKSCSSLRPEARHFVRLRKAPISGSLRIASSIE